MASGDIPVAFDFELDNLRRQLAAAGTYTEAQIKKITDAWMKEARAQRKVLADSVAERKRAAKAAADAETKAAEKAAEDVEKAADKLSGGLLGDLKDYDAALAGLGPVAEGAAVAIGGLAIGGAVLAAELAAIAGASIAVVAGLTNATLGADDFLRTLKELEAQGADTRELLPEISDGQLSAIRDANAAIEALGLISGKISAQVGAEFAPVLRSATIAAVAAGLAISDLVAEGARLASGIGEWYKGLSPFKKALVDNISPIIGATVSIASLGDTLASGEGAFGDYGKRAADLIGEMVDLKIRTDGAAAATDALNAALALQSSIDSSRSDLATEESKINAELARQLDLIDEQAAKTGDAALAEQARAEAWARHTRDMGALDEERAAKTRALDAEIASERQAQAQIEFDRAVEAPLEALDAKIAAWKEEQKILEAQADLREKIATQAISSASTLAGLLQSHHERRLDAIREERAAERERLGSLDEATRESYRERASQEKKSIMTAFRAQQGLAIAAAAMSAAQAALAMIPGIALALGPLAAGAPAVAAGLAGAAFATQAAVIASQEPPKFHTGRTPDEIPATLLRSEGVLSAQGVRAAGGSEAVRRLNEGRGGGGGEAVYVTALDGRVVASVLAREVRGSGPVGQAIRGLTGVARPGTTSAYGRRK